MNQSTTPDPRFRAWLAERAAQRAPDGLIHRAMQEVDRLSQERGWSARWPMLRFAAPMTATALVVIAVVAGTLLLNRPPEVVGPQPTVSLAQTPQPSVPPRDAEVTARIALPHPDPQTAFEEQVAVTDGAIWTAGFSGTNLIQISASTNQVVSDVPIDPAQLAAGDGQLWTLTPWGEIPGPATMQLSRVDLATGKPQAVAEVSVANRMAVGLGGIWLANGELRLLDGTSGHLVRSLPVSPVRLSTACNALWAWGLGEEPSWMLDRLDPETGKVLDHYVFPEGISPELTEVDGMCWTHNQSTLYGVRAGQAARVIASQVSGTLQIAGDSVWSIAGSVIQRVDPRSGTAMGQAWRLPADDLRIVNAKIGPDWRLLSAGGSLWLLRGDAIIRYAIPTS